MSLDKAKQIITQGLQGVASPIKPMVSVTTAPRPSQPTAPATRPAVSNNLFSPVPKSVLKENGITTYTLPDGREFRLDDRGRPVVSERSLTTKEKKDQRGGTFQQTQQEVDHKVPISLGGTDASGNLQLLKSKKTISQTVFDAITGKERLPGEYKPENRQEGKMIVEWKALDKYEKGQVTLFEAMAAVQNYDNPTLVADFLHEPKPKASILKQVASAMNPNTGGPVGHAVDFIKDKIGERRRQGALNEVMGFIGGKHYFDKEDGRALIAEVGENMTAKEATIARSVVRENKGIIESPFTALPIKEQALKGVTAPVRFTAGELARFAVGLGLEITGSDATFSPQTNLQEYFMGKEDFHRFSKSGDLYGTVMNSVEDKLLEKGVSYDIAHKSGLTSAIVLGIVVENPFFSFGSKPIKEGLEVALKESLQRELGTELPETLLKGIAHESERISKLASKEEKQIALQEFIEKVKSDPPPFTAPPKPFVPQPKPKSFEEPIDVFSGSKKQIETKTIDPKKDRLLIVDTEQRELLEKLASEGNQDATKAIEALRGGDRSDADDLLRSIYGDKYDYIVYKKSDNPKIGVEFHDLKNDKHYTSFETEAQLYAMQSRGLQYGAPTSSRLLEEEQALLRGQEGRGTVASTASRAEKSLSELSPKLSSKVPSFTDILTQGVSNVKDKINILDYVRTPDRVLKKLGLEKESKLIRKGYDAYVKELPQNIEKVTQWSKQVPKESNERIFQFLDGKEVNLNETEKRVANEIKDWLSEWADRLGIPQENRIANYITHIFDEQLLAKEFDEDLAKIIAEKLPGEVYDPFLQKRLGALGFKQDTWAALDAYVKRATRKVNMDEGLEALRAKVGSSLETTRLEQSQFEYIKRYVDNINLRPHKIDSLLDNTIKSVVGYKFGQRPVTRLLKILRQITYRGMLGLNPGSALRNLSQGVNTYSVLGEKYTSIGYASLFKGGAMKELEESGVLANSFIQDRALSATGKVLEKLDKGLFSFFETAEKINRGAAYFGAKAKALKQGKTMEEAIEFAKETVRKTQFTFDSVDTPVVLQGDIMKTLTQFQSFTVKQTEFLAEMVKDKNFIGLLRYAAGGALFAYTVGKAFGMEMKDLVPGFRTSTPPSLKVPVEIGKAVLDTPDKYGKQRDIRKKLSDVGKAFINLIPGGAQIKKTIEGARSIQEGGSYDRGGNLQFEQGTSVSQKAQALLFGKYASQNAKEYFDEGAKSSGERRYLEIMDLPVDERAQAFNDLKEEDPELASRVKAVAQDVKTGITDDEKVIRNLGVENGDRADAVIDELSKLETKEEKAALWNDYVEKRILTDSVKKQVLELLANKE